MVALIIISTKYKIAGRKIYHNENINNFSRTTSAGKRALEFIFGTTTRFSSRAFLGAFYFVLFFNLIISSSQCHICMEPSRLFRKAAEWCCDLDLARCSGALKPLFVHTPGFITHYCCHNFSWAPIGIQSRTLLVDKTTGKLTSRC